jgi:CHAD domain-containing protein
MAKGWEIGELDPNSPTREVARKIIQTKFCEAFSHREAVVANADIEAVHNMRVSLRRLWAAMRIFGVCFDKEPGFDRLISKTRKLARRLGSVRDLDVLIEMLQIKLEKSASTNEEQAALNHLLEYCQRRRDKQFQKLLEHLAKLQEKDFEVEFLDFFANLDSALSIATIPSY